MTTLQAWKPLTLYVAACAALTLPTCAGLLYLIGLYLGRYL